VPLVLFEHTGSRFSTEGLATRADVDSVVRDSPVGTAEVSDIHEREEDVMHRFCCALASIVLGLLPACATGSSVDHPVKRDYLEALGKVRPLLVANPEFIAMMSNTWNPDWTIQVTNMGLALPITEIRVGYWTDMNGNAVVDDGEINPADPRSSVITVTGQDCKTGSKLEFNATCSIHLHLVQSTLHHAIGIYSNGALMLTIKVFTS
jgi:hypothetical protein